MAGGRAVRLHTRAVLALLVVGAALFAAAMVVYPGGTWMDRTTVGHRFWGNFLCDLQQPVALNGVPNPVGARLAQVAMIALFAAWIPLWGLLAALLPRGRYGAWTRALGVTASIAACAIPLFPSGRWGSVHAIAIAVAALPGLTALLLTAAGIVRAGAAPASLRTLTVLFVGLACLNASFYGVHLARGGAVPLLLPAVQKVTVLLFGLWAVGVVRVAGRHT